VRRLYLLKSCTRGAGGSTSQKRGSATCRAERLPAPRRDRAWAGRHATAWHRGARRGPARCVRLVPWIGLAARDAQGRPGRPPLRELSGMPDTLSGPPDGPVRDADSQPW